MDLYSVTTVMKEYDGYKNASFHWFYCDARTIPRPYVDLIANYNGMNKLRAVYAEGYIDESFTLDEAQTLKDYLDRTFGHKGTTTIKKRKLPITNNWWDGKRLPIITMSGSWMKFQAIRCHSKLRVALIAAIHLRTDKSSGAAPNTAAPRP